MFAYAGNGGIGTNSWKIVFKAWSDLLIGNGSPLDWEGGGNWEIEIGKVEHRRTKNV